MTNKELFNRCVDVAAAVFNIPHELITGKSGKREVVEVRRIITCYMHAMPHNYGCGVIAKYFNKDRTTAIYWLTSGSTFYELDLTYKASYDLFVINMEKYNA